MADQPTQAKPEFRIAILSKFNLASSSVETRIVVSNSEGHEEQISRTIFSMQDEHIRHGLIQMGWTPPAE